MYLPGYFPFVHISFTPGQGGCSRRFPGKQHSSGSPSVQLPPLQSGLISGVSSLTYFRQHPVSVANGCESGHSL